MNWRRGLLRLWLVTSLGWIVLVGHLAHTGWWLPRQTAFDQTACADARHANPSLGNPFDCFDPPSPSAPSGTLQFVRIDSPPPMSALVKYAALALLPILAALALGAIIAWIIAGFRRTAR
jgi:hypothetical protein